MRSMKRRKFITLAATATAAFGLTSFKFLSYFTNTTAKVIADELHFLKLDPAGIEQFVSDHFKNKDILFRLRLKGYCFLGLVSVESEKVKKIVNLYLLSTDFFANGMDETRTIKYVAYYNPYLRPCMNPFSHNYYA